MDTINRTILAIYGLPPSYASVTYKDTGLVQVRQEQLEAKVSKAPNSGSLTVTGTAAPLATQLIKEGRTVRGINFLDRSSTAFDIHQNPQANIVVLYNVGVEVSLNSKVSGMVLNSIVQHYSERPTLLIIETKLSGKELLQRYDFRITNHVSIPKKDEDIWI